MPAPEKMPGGPDPEDLTRAAVDTAVSALTLDRGDQVRTAGAEDDRIAGHER